MAKRGGVQKPGKAAQKKAATPALSTKKETSFSLSALAESCKKKWFLPTLAYDTILVIILALIGALFLRFIDTVAFQLEALFATIVASGGDSAAFTQQIDRLWKVIATLFILMVALLLLIWSYFKAKTYSTILKKKLELRNYGLFVALTLVWWRLILFIFTLIIKLVKPVSISPLVATNEVAAFMDGFMSLFVSHRIIFFLTVLIISHITLVLSYYFIKEEHVSALASAWEYGILRFKPFLLPYLAIIIAGILFALITEFVLAVPGGLSIFILLLVGYVSWGRSLLVTVLERLGQ